MLYGLLHAPSKPRFPPHAAYPSKGMILRQKNAHQRLELAAFPPKKFSDVYEAVHGAADLGPAILVGKEFVNDDPYNRGSDEDWMDFDYSEDKEKFCWDGVRDRKMTLTLKREDGKRVAEDFPIIMAKICEFIVNRA